MHKRRLALALLALLALAALVVGCGGGSSSSSSDNSTSTTSSTERESSDNSSSDEPGAAPTKAAFIKEADKICGESDAVMAEEITDYAKENDISTEKEPSEDQQIEIFHEVVLPNIGKQAEELAALTPPAGDEGTVEDITDTLTSEIENAEGEEGVPDESTLEEASKKAKAYGLKTCGS